MSLKKYCSDELFEFRKQLLDWKIRGPKTILTILSLLQYIQKNSQLGKTEIIKSKLYKSIKVVKQQMLAGTEEEKYLYTNDLIEAITSQLKLGNLHREIFDIIGPRKKSPENIIPEQKDDQVQQNDKPVEIEQPQVHKFTHQRDEREEFRQKLIKTAIKLKDEYFNRNPELITIYQLADKNIEERITMVIEKLEDILYTKNVEQFDSFWRYQEDLKTLSFLKQYIKKDSSGHVFAKLLSGIFPVSEAAKLRLEDWVDEKLTRVSLKEQYLMDANHQKTIRLQIMSEAQGQECPRCKENLFYMVEEKQIRRADEPSTKFYECFACSFRARY